MRETEQMKRFAVLLAGFLLISSPAYAYIDPGILGVLYQAAYALIFGTFLALVIRPWQYLKGVFGRITGRGGNQESRVKPTPVSKGDRD
jgi:hypothetical protein